MSTQWRGGMTELDRRCVQALQAVRFGQGKRAGEISHALHLRMTKGQPITVRERHALYAIAYRFRTQLPAELLDQVTASLAGAAAAVALIRMERSADYPQARPPRPAIRAVRNLGPRPTTAANLLNDLFPTPA
ncbi:MAG: hypothetical protein ACK4JB_17225 [Reyranella sp.]